MKKNRPLTVLALIFSIIAANAQQISYFNQGFLRQQNAAQDLAWLGLNPSGSGSVTNFTAGNFSPLFTSTVTTPTTWPHLSFNPIGQLANLVYASPDGVVGFPSFRALTLADLPTLPSGGSVTNFSMGNMSPLFTTSVANPTTFPEVTLSPVFQSRNTVFAGPTSGVFPGIPAFRFLVTGDLPDLTTLIRSKVSGTSPIDYVSGTGVFSMHVSDSTHDGYLSFTDWISFNAKQSALTFGNLSDVGTDGITVGSGTGAVIGSGTTISQHASDATHNGYLSSADWNTFNGKGVGTVISITNSGIQSANNTLVATSNAPTLGIKSISAGANTSITDQGGTNLVIAASGIAGGSGLTDLMQYQTNYLATYRTVAPDATQFGTATFIGVGDSIGISLPAGGSGVLVWNFGSPALGPWVQMVTGASSGNTSFIATSTDNAVAAYTNGGFYFQTYVLVRNTNSVRIAAGFTSSSFASFLANDTTITNYAYFRYSTLSNDATWHGVVCDATNRFFVDIGAPLIPETGYLLQMWKTNGTTNVVFAVNRTNVATATAFAPNRTAQLSDLMGVFAGEATLSNAAKTNWFRYIGYTVDWAVK